MLLKVAESSLELFLSPGSRPVFLEPVPLGPGGSLADARALSDRLKPVLPKKIPARAVVVLPPGSVVQDFQSFPRLSGRDAFLASKRLARQLVAASAVDVRHYHERAPRSSRLWVGVSLSGVGASWASALKKLGLKKVSVLPFQWYLALAAGRGVALWLSSGQAAAALCERSVPTAYAISSVSPGPGAAGALSELASSFGVQPSLPVTLFGEAENPLVREALSASGWEDIRQSSGYPKLPARLPVDFAPLDPDSGKAAAAFVLTLALAAQCVGLGVWASLSSRQSLPPPPVDVSSSRVASEMRALQSQREALMKAAPSQGVPWSDLYRDLASASRGVTLERASVKQTNPHAVVELRGVAPDAASLLSFLDALERRPFSRPFLSQVSFTASGVSFSVSVVWSNV